MLKVTNPVFIPSNQRESLFPHISLGRDPLHEQCMPNDVEIIHNRIYCITIKNREWSCVLMTLPVGYVGSLCCSVSLTAFFLVVISSRAECDRHCSWSPQVALLCCHAPCCLLGPGSFCIQCSNFHSDVNAVAWLRI